MSVNKLNMPAESPEADIHSKPEQPEAQKLGNNRSAETHRKGNGPDSVSKEFENEDSANAAANRLRNNANDPTDKDPTRSSNKPLSGKIQP